MRNHNMSEKVIEQYQKDGRAMVLVYAQWCINEGFDPLELYRRAYPNQPTNDILSDILDQTVDKHESQHIPYGTVLQMLQLFGNDDLAFVIQNEMEKREAEQKD